MMVNDAGQVEKSDSSQRSPIHSSNTTPSKVQEWFRTNTYDAADFPVRSIADRKAALGVKVTLILPSRNVRPTIEAVLREVGTLATAEIPLIDQILVVDANSTDGTAAVAEAFRSETFDVEVWSEDALAPSFGPVLGKGDAMWRSLIQARGDIVLFADTDTIDFKAQIVAGMLGTLLCVPQIKFVKAAFDRPFATTEQTRPDEGGRVTELTARPLFNMFFPSLAGFVQPLAGEFGAWRNVLREVVFVTGYGVESGLLIDVCDAVGIEAMGQVDVGTRQNRHQPLSDLSRMSFAVARTILHRARKVDRVGPTGSCELLSFDHPSSYLHAAASAHRPTLTTTLEVLVERPPLASFTGLVTNREASSKRFVALTAASDQAGDVGVSGC